MIGRAPPPHEANTAVSLFERLPQGTFACEGTALSPSMMESLRGVYHYSFGAQMCATVAAAARWRLLSHIWRPVEDALCSTKESTTATIELGTMETTDVESDPMQCMWVVFVRVVWHIMDRNMAFEANSAAALGDRLRSACSTAVPPCARPSWR